MATYAQRRTLRLLVGWLLVSVAGLAAVDAFTVSHWVVVSVLGALVVVQWTAPLSVLPAWRRRLRLPLVFAFLAFLAAVGYDLSTQVGTL
ncbi:hypothetical protein [Natronomonas gomsonensis]|uniref:hypothetical protein n=1 Tax=Natronomonas gomsonensis TaxID=1046043 RepID=UPI0015BF4895|nr:hypothetical protein [Natronomonas gomsonensis]